MRKVGHWSEAKEKKENSKRVPPENLKIKRPLKVNYVYLMYFYSHDVHSIRGRQEE